MKLTGYILFFLGVAVGLTVRFFAPESELGIVLAGILLLLGSVILFGLAAISIFRRRIIFRPKNALKFSAIFLPVSLVFTFALYAALGRFGEMPEKWPFILVSQTLTAIFVGLWLTAFRKPI
jgi:uncharacterized membrane protein